MRTSRSSNARRTLPANLIVDAHLDLSMNALEWNRDLTQSVFDIRAREAGRTDKPDRARGTVAFPEMRRGRWRSASPRRSRATSRRDNPLPGWHSQEQAWAQTQGQLAWYREMEDARRDASDRRPARRSTRISTSGRATPRRIIRSATSSASKAPTRSSRLQHLERAYAYGLRAVGPAHYGPGVHAFGTDSDGGLSASGRALLKKMEELGIILDATHLCDTSFWEAMDLFHGPVWASHNNVRALVPHNRQFDDDQLRLLIQRGAVIGAAFDAWMIVPGWTRGQSTPEALGVTLDRIVDHIDHICQLAGNARHVGIGSDLDGAFGKEQCPTDIETIGDLHRLRDRFAARGYSADDIEGMMFGNWIRFLDDAWSR